MSTANVVREEVNKELQNEAFERAIALLQRVAQILGAMPSHGSIQADGINEELASILQNFRKKAEIAKYIQWIRILVETRQSYGEISAKKNNPKMVKAKHDLSVRWNKALNPLLDCLEEESILNDLLFMNGHHGFYKRVLRNPRPYRDISTLERRGVADKDAVVCHVSQGRINADSQEEMIARIGMYLQDVTDPHSLVIERGNHNGITWGIECNDTAYGIKPNTWAVKIPIPQTDPDSGRATGKYSYVSTNDPNILQLFFGGSFPGYRKINRILTSELPQDANSWKKFYRFARLVRTTIFKLLNLSGRVPGSPGHRYVVITCPRGEPRLCGCETVIVKPSTHAVPHVCRACTMQLCPLGCGRAHHGGGCELPADAASIAFIAQTTKTCPGCQQQVHKFADCNHITCVCRVQFCYLCGVEYTKNAYGRYDEGVTAHHSARGHDGQIICSQF